ncbi:large subunit ribosomal protein L6 [Methylohalomonas lacus]|uniref:Large ribosomal subunit protein uL6 n=1 Tax=Methylohalomonas lacus TaxID=398773 RepID=A0AAE3HL13_9GAMM|nr:50S ribosomal protein L6 [Methylohalomonas lacus]MCS3903183.1 large subunit ribosomal protein L6 [Methylohalomonas lacus]
MSRIAKYPITLPDGVEAKLDNGIVTIKGKKGESSYEVNPDVVVTVEDGQIKIAARDENSKKDWAQAGTTRARLQNMVTGLGDGFERKLTIIGVGYRAQAQGQKLNLTLGFSHPVVFDVPEGITVETPSQTEVVVKGMDRQLVGHVAAKIRGYRPPEPYKGKGVRYSDERVIQKEAKKS